MAGVVLQSRVPSASAWRGATGTFSDSESYISAPESRNDGRCPFVSAMLLRRRSFSRVICTLISRALSGRTCLSGSMHMLRPWPSSSSLRRAGSWAIRHDVGAAPNAVRPFCGATPSMRHYVERCRMAPLLRVFFYTRLLLALQDFCPRWRVPAVSRHEICILHGHDLFGIRLGTDPFHVPAAYPCATLGLTGEITPRDVALLLARGNTRTALQHAVSYVLNEVAALYRKHSSLTLPVVPNFSACHDPQSIYVFH